MKFYAPATGNRKSRLATSKVWKKPLAHEDYGFEAFAEWPKEALNVAWLWELDRELGSGRAAFYLSWQRWTQEKFGDDKFEAPVKRRPILRAYPLAQAAKCLYKPGGMALETQPAFTVTGKFAQSAYSRIHALEIDWRKTESELVEAFRNWLRDGDHEFSPDIQSDSRHKVGKRSTASLLSYLRDLAIYRISEAGYTRGEGLKLIGGKMSAQNWERAQRRIREKIRGRFETLLFLEEMAEQENRKRGFWKDHFIDMDALEPSED